MHQQDLILRIWPFLMISMLYCIIGLTLDKFYGEIALHQIFNQYHHPMGDFFFKYYTQTGEWILIVLILIFILFKENWRYFWMFLSATLLQIIIVQSTKKTFFIDHLRPGFYFQEQGLPIYLIDGVRQGITFAFPSGHTASAFLLFGFMALFLKHRILQLILGIAAALTAYSRIYLSQHYMQDTIGGALIGLFCLVVSYYIWFSFKSESLDKRIKFTKTKN